MMVIRQSVVIVALALLIQTPTLTGQILKDPGTLTCESWIGLRSSYREYPLSNPFSDAVTGWMQGYFAGADALGFALTMKGLDGSARDSVRAGLQTTAAMLNAEGVPKWLDGYCPTHNDESLSVVALRLLRSAYKL